MARQAVISWSGGKDSAMALHKLQTHADYREFSASWLLTTMTSHYDRISGHGLRRAVLERQAESIGLHVEKVYIARQSDMHEYETVMEAAYRRYKRTGAEAVVFGDVFLKGPKKIHSAALLRADINGLFPLWHRSTKDHADEIIDVGIKAVVICVDGAALDRSFVGRKFDRSFIAALPAAADPCGENGEFHTFVYGGPMFGVEVPYRLGEVVARGSHFYCDVM